MICFLIFSFKIDSEFVDYWHVCDKVHWFGCLDYRYLQRHPLLRVGFKIRKLACCSMLERLLYNYTLLSQPWLSVLTTKLNIYSTGPFYNVKVHRTGHADLWRYTYILSYPVFDWDKRFVYISIIKLDILNAFYKLFQLNNCTVGMSCSWLWCHF